MKNSEKRESKKGPQTVKQLMAGPPGADPQGGKFSGEKVEKI